MIPTNKNIAVLHPYINKKGGAVQMMLHVSDVLSKENKVVFHTFEFDKSKGFGLFRDFEIKNYFKGFFGKPISFLLIAYQIRKCDYVMIGNSPMHFVGVISKILFFSKAKLIWWHHHYPWYYSENTFFLIFCKRPLERLAVRYIDCLLANSLYLQQSLKETYNRGSQILYPIMDKGFENHKQILKQNTFTLISYGRWVEGKNIDLIFHLYESLKKDSPSLNIIIGGIGDHLEKYKTIYKGNKNISFVGELDQKSIRSYLGKADIFLFPSKIDSFGLVLLESMSQGVPVICFEKPGQDEVVDNNKTGFLVNSDSEFIGKTKLLLEDDSLRKSFSAEGVIKASGFNSQAFEKRLSNIWKSL